MARLTKAQRAAKKKEKYEKRQRNRAKVQEQPLPPEPASAEPQQVSQAPEAQAATGQQREPKAGARPPSTRAESAIAWFTAVLTVFAIVQGIAMIAQNQIMSRQIKQTDETIKQLRLDQRAWLTFLPPTMPKLEKGSRTQSFVQLTNTGKTPAIIKSAISHMFTHRTRADIGDYFEKTRRTLRRSNRNTIVGPGRTVQMERTDDTSREWDDTEIDAIKRGILTLYLVTIFTYEDVAGEAHTLQACFIYEPIPHRFYNHPKYDYMD